MLTPPPSLRLIDGWREDLTRRYAVPRRHYHTMAHIEDVARRFAEVPDWTQPAEVFAAVLLHDVIYVPGASDNEAQSAALAPEWLAQYADSEVDVERVAALIRWTAIHGQLSPDDVDLDAARFLDCDMAILSAEASLYDAYAAGVAAEYGFVPPAMYRAGRGAFLEGLLASERIFLSSSFHEALDAAARVNIARELAALRSAEEPP